MTLKIDVIKRENSNSSLVAAYNVLPSNGKPINADKHVYVVPDKNVDEFIKSYKKKEKLSLFTILPTTLIGAATGMFVGLGANKKNYHYLDFVASLTLIGALIGGTPAFLLHNHKEKKMLEKFEAQEVEV